MPCKDMEERLSAYADGEARAAEKSVVESHLADCADCRLHLRWILSLKTAAKRAQLPSAPADLNDLLIGAARRRRPAAPSPLSVLKDFWRRQVSRPRLAWGLAAACAAILVFAVSRRQTASESLSVDWMLAAHTQSELAIPSLTQELAVSNLAEHLADAAAVQEPHALE